MVTATAHGRRAQRPNRSCCHCRGANVAGLGLSNVLVLNCRGARAHNLDKLRLESDVTGTETGSAARRGGDSHAPPLGCMRRSRTRSYLTRDGLAFLRSLPQGRPPSSWTQTGLAGSLNGCPKWRSLRIAPRPQAVLARSACCVGSPRPGRPRRVRAGYRTAGRRNPAFVAGALAGAAATIRRAEAHQSIDVVWTGRNPGSPPAGSPAATVIDPGV